MVCLIQVKRRRTEDPLDALILHTSKRKRRQDDDAADSDLFFKFAGTNNVENVDSRMVLESAENEAGERQLRASLGAKKVKKEAPAAIEGVAPELQEMLADYIKPQLDGRATIDPETEEYVYDVYFREMTGSEVAKNVGYIELNEHEEKLLFDYSDSEEEDPQLGGDEDSNAEDYYQNDYPDEESSSDSDGLEARIGTLGLNEQDEWSLDEEDPADASYERYGWR